MRGEARAEPDAVCGALSFQHFFRKPLCQQFPDPDAAQILANMLQPSRQGRAILLAL
jgi:hypothetical protein